MKPEEPRVCEKCGRPLKRLQVDGLFEEPNGTWKIMYHCGCGWYSDYLDIDEDDPGIQLVPFCRITTVIRSRIQCCAECEIRSENPDIYGPDCGCSVEESRRFRATGGGCRQFPDLD